MRKILVAATAVTLMATACGDNGQSGGGTDKVTVGVIAIVDVAPIYLGNKQGIFKKHGIDLTMQVGSGGAASVPGVVSGKFQFAFGNITSLLVARDKGLPLKIVTNGVSSTGEKGKDFGAVVVPADSPIKTAKDLAGKTVSVNNLKNIGDTTIRALVRNAGGDPSTIKFVPLPFPDAPAALQKKQVDAAWVVEPFVTVATSQGARPIAWNFAEAVPDLGVAMYFTSEQVEKDKPDLVKRFRDAMNESLEYADGHPDEVRDILGTYTKITPDIAAKIILPKWPQEVNRDSIDAIAKLAKGDGLLTKDADINALLGD